MALTGRFAPSPTGDLHLGNLRTALLSWLMVRGSARGTWIVRMEDLDRVTSSDLWAERQLEDLATIGLSSDVEVVSQSQRFTRYHAAIAELTDRGLVYPCFCTRREIAEAAAAPHGDTLVAYPGTCRDLGARRRAELLAAGRRPALRVRSDGRRRRIPDALLGQIDGVPDDVVIERNDGVPAYNLAVVVDDAAQRVTQVVRGDDLASSTPRQVMLQELLGLPTPTYAHVPLVLGVDGQRLAKRHGAVTLRALAAAGVGPRSVLRWLAHSLGVDVGGELAVDVGGEAGTASSPITPTTPPTSIAPRTPSTVIAPLMLIAERFDLDRVPRHPVHWTDVAAGDLSRF